MPDLARAGGTVDPAGSGGLVAAVREGAAALATLASQGRAEAVGERDLRLLLTAAVAACSARMASGGGPPVFDDSVPIDRTDVLRVVDGMLAALDLEPFEVSMWRSWGGA